MRLSKLYTNKPKLFAPIDFVSGLNVVIAEIRLPKDKQKDTHNLGKTTLGRIVDFALLSSKDDRFFLFKHLDLFKDFVFFLEIEMFDGSFLTIRRNVENATKISFKKHDLRFQDFNDIGDTEWDHLDMPFTRAKNMLDSLLDLRSIAPWTYRNCLGYFLRSQSDFQDVFHLGKFAGQHSQWKPFLAHMLGFNAEQIKKHYNAEEELEEKNKQESILKSEIHGSLEDLSKIEGLILIKRTECEKKQKYLDALDFGEQDKEQTKNIVNDYDIRIAELNSERYKFNQNLKKVIMSLDSEKILFNPNDAEKLFKEAGVYFAGQVKKDFEQLIAFNKAITEERTVYLFEEKKEIENILHSINEELKDLGEKRKKALSFLSSTNIFDKYKEFSNEIVKLKTDIMYYERQKESLQKLQKMRVEIEELASKKRELQREIDKDINIQNSDKNSLFSKLRLFFNEIIETVIDRKALLSVSMNREGHLDFSAEILDDAGRETSAQAGYTYKKLLCVAFDLAVLRAHLNQNFLRFVYHDGIFESLDDRKKEKLLEVIKEYSALGIQNVITLIDSDLPKQSSIPVFTDDEIVLTLHDESGQGRLFKMASW